LVGLGKIKGVRLGTGVEVARGVAEGMTSTRAEGVGVHVGGRMGTVGVEVGRIKTGTGVSGGNGLRAELGSVKMMPTIPATRQTPRIINIDKTFQMDDDFIESP
jgi:hypothetical protein